jgi:hypothetical protein
MSKPAYADQEFDAALESYATERRKLVDALDGLDEAGWARGGTFTGTSARGRSQTVLSYATRLAEHEQEHMDQIDSLLRSS